MSRMSKGERMWPRLDVRAEGPVQEIGVDREVLGPQDRIALGLEVDLDLVPDPRIHVIRPGQHEDGGPVLARAPLEDLARALPQPF